MQPIHEDQEQDQSGHEPHPNPRGEEGCTVTGIGETCSVIQTEALNLYDKKKKRGHLDALLQEC